VLILVIIDIPPVTLLETREAEIFAVHGVNALFLVDLASALVAVIYREVCVVARLADAVKGAVTMTAAIFDLSH
jgi:hypothetical protein